jgi:hypothetical protein
MISTIDSPEIILIKQNAIEDTKNILAFYDSANMICKLYEKRKYKNDNYFKYYYQFCMHQLLLNKSKSKDK